MEGFLSLDLSENSWTETDIVKSKELRKNCYHQLQGSVVNHVTELTSGTFLSQKLTFPGGHSQCIIKLVIVHTTAAPALYIVGQ